MYVIFSRYCSLHYRCKMLACLFITIVISGRPLDAIISLSRTIDRRIVGDNKTWNCKIFVWKFQWAARWLAVNNATSNCSVYMNSSVFHSTFDSTHDNLRSEQNCMLLTRTNVLGRFHPFIGHKVPQGQQRYSSTLFLTSALEGGEGSASRPGRTLPPGKTRYPLYRRLGGPQGRSGQVQKISPPPRFDPRTVQPVGSKDATFPHKIHSPL